MKKGLKYFLFVVLGIGLILGAIQFYKVNLNYNIKTITKNKVYSSGVIPPEKIKNYVEDLNIKTIIDFRHPSVIDPLNPANATDIALEKNAVNKIPGVQHISIPSEQVPTQQNLDSLFKVLDDKNAYPVLMHCHHGTGRAQIYSAIYRIEYENFDNQKAREGTRIILKGSSFDDGKPKGEFLKAYKPRQTKQ